MVGELGASQTQVIIKLKNKKFIKNCRLISLNVDIKLISTALAFRLKKNVYSTTVNENQVAFVNNRFISESGRLVSNVLEITNSLEIEGF